MTNRFRVTIMALSLAASALLAHGAVAVSCLGTGGGGTGGACAEYANQGACERAVCGRQSQGDSGAADAQGGAGCAPGTSCTAGTGDASLLQSNTGCSCTCFADNKECEAARSPAVVPFTPITLQNPLGTGDVRQLAARGILAITGIAGSVALLMFVWGGFLWITSAGSAEKAKKAKEIFVNAVYGLVLIFGSYALINALLNAFAGTAT